MRLSNFRPARRHVLSLGLGSLLALGATASAFATADSGVTITGGSLSGGAMSFAGFTGVTLNGTQQTTTASWTIANISDARGTGAGWNESLTLTQLKQYNTTGGIYTLNGNTLPTSSIKSTSGPTVTAADATSSATTTLTAVAANTALDTGAAVKLLDAAANGGMGSYSFGALSTTLTVPANAYAATYKTDATVSLNSVP